MHFKYFSYVFEYINLANDGMRNTYGSLDQRISNIVYTNGQLDPLFNNGIIQSYYADSVVLNINRKIFALSFPSD